MRKFLICLAAIMFLMSELIGLIKGDATAALITRSLCVFLGFYILGEIFCIAYKRMGPRSEVEEEAVSQSTQETVAAPEPAISESLRQKIASDPKQTAQIIDTMISQ